MRCQVYGPLLPGRIHLAQNRKSRLTRPKKSKCDSPALLRTHKPQAYQLAFSAPRDDQTTPVIRPTGRFLVDFSRPSRLPLMQQKKRARRARYGVIWAVQPHTKKYSD